MVVLTYLVLIPQVALARALPSFTPSVGPELLLSLGITGRIILGSIIVPAIETAVFQWLPVRVLRQRFRLAWFVVVPVSAALFAAAHWYGASYVLFAFLIGLVLIYCYAIGTENGGYPFLTTYAVHAVRNTIAAFVI
jgi:hypothetical protein